MVRTLARCAAVLESAMGDTATDILQAIYRETLSWFSRAGASIDDILLTLDLAKGHRFSTALSRSGERAELWTTAEPEVRVLDQTGVLDVDGLSEDEVWLREVRQRSSLVVPYREDLELALWDSQVYELAKRRFDAQVYAAAFAVTENGLAQPTPDLPSILPKGELVLDLYLGRTAQAERALFITAASSAGGWAATTQPVPVAVPRRMPADEAEFARPLEPEEIDLINQLTGSHRSHDDVVVKAGDVVVLPYTEFLTDLVRDAVRHPAGPKSEVTELRQLLESTTAALLGPAAELLRQHLAAGGNKVTVVPHGALRAFPFHLLRLDGETLGERCCVTYATTLGSLAIPVAAGHARDEVAAFAYAAGDPDAGFPELPDVTAEAVEIAGMFGVEAHVDEAATASSFLDALETSRYVHIATHGGVDEVPSFHHLVTAADAGTAGRGRLYAFQILDRDLRGVELVTLSACTTSLVRFDTADNPRGIVANLLLRGARYVVGALWPVRTEVAHYFFVELYGELRAGMAAIDAFAAAQRATRAYYAASMDWAVFVLIDRGKA